MNRCSIIIPAYNVERYVTDALDSAVGQTYQETEVVVVNDGSTDATADAIAPYRSRIVYVEQENRGPAAARNIGIREATGEFIALLDADDVFLPSRVERMMAYLHERTDVGFATSHAFMLYGRRASTDLFDPRPFPTNDQPYHIFRANFIMVMTVMRRELFDRYGMFDEEFRASADWDMWIRFIWGGERAGFVDEPLAYYRRRREGLTATMGPVGMLQEDLLVARRNLRRHKAIVIHDLDLLVLEKARLAAGIRDFRSAARFARWVARNRHSPITRRVKAVLAAIGPRLAFRMAYERDKWRGSQRTE